MEHAKFRRYPAKSNIIHFGDICDTLYLLVKGQVTVFLERDDQREVIVSYVNVGDFFGELGLFNKEKNQERSAFVRAKTACEVYELSYEDCYKVFKDIPEFFSEINNKIINRLLETTQKVNNLAFLDVKNRVIEVLKNLCKQPDALTHPDGTQIKTTRQEIGRIANCSREMVGRVLKVMQEDGILYARGKTIVLYDKKTIKN